MKSVHGQGREKDVTARHDMNKGHNIDEASCASLDDIGEDLFFLCQQL